MTAKINFEKFTAKCNWNKDIACKCEYFCQICAHQPPDDGKSNGKKPPVKIGWKTSYGGIWPECPACGEMPHSTERCVFCGQRFIQEDDSIEEYNNPAPEERMDCFLCGGKETLVGRRTQSNGHFHGQCEKCGMWVME